MPFYNKKAYKDLSETGLMDLSTEAANAFLNDTIPLNFSIQKIAEREDLTTHEIHRVVEEANKSVYLALRPKMASVGKPVFEFDTADRDVILANLQKKAEQITRHWTPSETNEAMTKAAVDKFAELISRSPERFGTPTQIVKRLIAEQELERDKIAEQIFAKKCAIKNYRKRFIKTAKNMIFQEGWNLAKLAEVLLEARPNAGELLGELLRDVRAACNIKAGSVKEAGAVYKGPLNKKLTISGEPVLIINGSHKLLMDLDTLVSQTNQIEGDQQGLYRVDDTIRYLRKNLKNMTSKEVVRPPHVFRRIQRKAKREMNELSYGK